jgi:hypothetical protein
MAVLSRWYRTTPLPFGEYQKRERNLPRPKFE